ncbi:hypothetical protein T4B_376, partial [Trichinella pseudospiralis]
LFVFHGRLIWQIEYCGTHHKDAHKLNSPVSTQLQTGGISGREIRRIKKQGQRISTQWRRPLVRIPLLVDLLPSALKSSERESKH